MAMDLDKFLSFPWGRLSFECMDDSIKSRDYWELANMYVTVQGFVHTLQLVVTEVTPSIQIRRNQLKGSGDEDEEEDGDKEAEKEGSADEKCGVPLLILNARDLDKNWKESSVDVDAFIHLDYEFPFPEEDLTWPNDIEDAKVTNMIRLAGQGKLDPKMFKGGHVMARIEKLVKKKIVQEGCKGRRQMVKRKR